MGALAFAAGAALGAALPHTAQEDTLMGEAADKVKREAGHLASDLYGDGKTQAGEVYKEASEAAGELYSDARSKLAGGSTASASS